MLLQIVAIIAGLGLTIWSADRFVDGAATTAARLGISPLVIGLTIIAVGTSAPEIATSALAAAQGYPGLGIGNAVGSNVANIGLILGITALVIPLKLRSASLRRELPLLIVVTLICLLLLANHQLERLEAGVMLLMFVASLLWLAWLAKQSGPDDPIVPDIPDPLHGGASLKTALGQLFLGLGVLLAAAQLLVWGAGSLAATLGVSELVVGLTIVAIGTSLPELATCIAAALKGQHDIAVGNIIGSNLFNLLIVLPLPGLIAPGPVPDGVLSRDYPVMIGFSLLIVVLARGFGGRGVIHRWQGGLLLLLFLAYQLLLLGTSGVGAVR
ncbi:calcium/sodium antiporter [Natronospira bacteriovora]|uniref:Calcium/sodium antiporter n=1 Tax=Natronospira bacteriovora TaxID=3069753 RepID=A0ABU0W6H8_9GAMM|nr:calcium/sodium antiporter [Natronospira sp. AB-CW4]MDQ2069533.1 calcium/sodium antiporter [Natronospira sp. AB-CW4]